MIILIYINLLILFRYYKNLKKIEKVEENMDNTKIKSKAFNERKLPNVIPIVMIKKIYDNPNLVDLVLKAYSIYPKNFNKDNLLEKSYINETIFKPPTGKFNHINLDTIYSDKNVCSNCYLVYILITSFISNIDEINSNCKL